MAVGQCQIGEKMVRGDGFAHREVGDRRVDMRDQMEPAGTDPRAFHDNIGQIVGDQLADFGVAVDAGNELQIDLGLGERRVVSLPLPAMLSCL